MNRRQISWKTDAELRSIIADGQRASCEYNRRVDRGLLKHLPRKGRPLRRAAAGYVAHISDDRVALPGGDMTLYAKTKTGKVWFFNDYHNRWERVSDVKLVLCMVQ